MPKVHEKTEDEVAHISTALEGNHRFTDILQNLNEAERLQFIGYMERSNVAAGVDIMTQGDEGDYFYVVQWGECDVFVKGQGKVTNPRLNPRRRPPTPPIPAHLPARAS